MAGFSILAKLGLDSSKFKAGLKTSDSALTKFGKAIGNVVKAGAAIATAAFAAFTVKGIKDLVAFEKGMNEVFTLLPGISKETMGQMSADVRSLAKTMGVDLMDATNALYQAISAGVPKENVFDFMEVASKAAIGGVTSLETAVDGITSVINTYGRETITAQEASDAMFTAVKLGKTTFEELSASLFNVLPIAKQAGVGFDEIAAALAVMTAKGTPTSVATTQLRQAITSLIAPTTKTAKHFESYGLSIANLKALMTGGDGGLVKAMQNVMNATNGDETAIRKLLGSTEAMNAVLTLTSGNAKSFGKAMDEMGKKTGATNTAFETMEQSVARNMVKMMGQLKELGLKFAAAFLPLINQLLPGLSAKFNDLGPAVAKFAGKFPKFIKDVKDIAAHFKVWGAALAAFMVTVKVLPAALAAWSAAQTLLGTTAKTAAASTAALSTAAKLTGVGVIVGSIAAVVAAYDEWGASMDERREQLRQAERDGWMDDMVEQIRATQKETDRMTQSARNYADELDRLRAIQEKADDPSLHIAKTRVELAKEELDLIKAKEDAALAEFLKAREHYEFEKEHWQGRLKADLDEHNRAGLTLQMNEKLTAAKKDEAKWDIEIEKLGVLRFKAEQKVKDAVKATADEKLNAIEAEAAAEAKAAEQLADFEDAAAEQAKAAEEARIEARDKEIKKAEELLALTEKQIAADERRADALKAQAEAKEQEVAALREELAEAEAAIDEQRPLWTAQSTAGGRPPVRANVHEMRAAYNAARAEGYGGTFDEFVEMKKKEMQDAVRERNAVIARGRAARAEAVRLREEEAKARKAADEKRLLLAEQRVALAKLSVKALGDIFTVLKADRAQEINFGDAMRDIRLQLAKPQALEVSLDATIDEDSNREKTQQDLLYESEEQTALLSGFFVNQ